jgi:ribonuclease R
VARPKGAPAGPRTRKQQAGKLPSKQDILDFLASTTGEAGKREVARAFGVKGGDRIALKELLREMAEDGLIEGSRRKLSRPGVLPPVTVLEITARDRDGEYVARPATWDEEHGPSPRILMVESRRETAPPAGVGDRVLARITALDAEAGYPYQARTIKKLPRIAGRSLLGIFRALPGGTGVIDPIDRKQLREWPVPRGSTGDA